MAKFENRNKKLYIDDKLVIRGWESYTGWYWFAIELQQVQDSVISGEIIKDDKIYFGFVQGFEEEWGDFSEGEINLLGNKAWEIPASNLQFSGRQN